MSIGREPVGSNRAPALKGSRRAYFDGVFRDTRVYDRYALAPGEQIDGPAIIEEHEATTVIPPGDRLMVDDELNLRITIGEGQRPIALVTPTTPLAEAVARLEADQIGLEIMWSRLITIVEECWQTVCRTAFSLIISEAQDFAIEILDRNGNPLAHSPRGMPVFNLTLPRAVKALIAKYPPEILQPGDVLITNDPWLCAGHLFDIAVVTPVFRRRGAYRANGHCRPCQRYRRHQGQPAGSRDLRGGISDPAYDALSPRPAQ